MSHTEGNCSKMFILALFIEAEAQKQILFQHRGMTMLIMLYPFEERYASITNSVYESF